MKQQTNIDCENTNNQYNVYLLDDMADCINVLDNYEALAIIIALAKNRIMKLNQNEPDRLN